MKTCPNCGAPQADSLPACNLCGYLFPGVQSPVKRRFEKRVLIALVSDLVSIIGTVLFFNFIWMQSYQLNSALMAVYNILFLAMVFITAAGPILGLIFSIVGLKKTKSTGTKGKPFAIAGIVISSILLPLAYFFIYMFVLAITS
ncbi:MAG: DUF4190 domain-containing protein [Lachnospiraceae bacterium]|nr:DUF4190 domain-containing protein [Lachnospiraceae bacterium]